MQRYKGMAGTHPSQEPPPDTASEDPRDRRKHVRKPVLWAARLETAAGSFDCVVLNLSLGGARLQVTAPILPPVVTLVMERFGALRAEIVWQLNDGIGLRFTADPDEVARTLKGALPLD